MKKILQILLITGTTLTVVACATPNRNIQVSLIEVDAPTWNKINANYQTPNNQTNYSVVPQENLSANEILNKYTYTTLLSQNLDSNSSTVISDSKPVKYVSSINTQTNPEGSSNTIESYNTANVSYTVNVQDSVDGNDLQFKIKTSAQNLMGENRNKDGVLVFPTVSSSSGSYTINIKYKDGIILNDPALRLPDKYRILVISTTSFESAINFDDN